MSLTNPNTPITEQDLQEFYYKIKPYIGTDAMPAADMAEIVSPLPSVMSRLPKYSTKEQIVGYWIDGKPIYQKTVTNLSITLSSSWDNLISIQDCELILSVNVIGTYSVDTYTGFIDSKLSGTQVQMKSTAALSHIVVNTATIQYTKTTDTPTV